MRLPRLAQGGGAPRGNGVVVEHRGPLSATKGAKGIFKGALSLPKMDAVRVPKGAYEALLKEWQTRYAKDGAAAVEDMVRMVCSPEWSGPAL